MIAAFKRCYLFLSHQPIGGPGIGKLKVTNETIPICLPQSTALLHSLNALILRSR
jgi:hypothetical protein